MGTHCEMSCGTTVLGGFPAASLQQLEVCENPMQFERQRQMARTEWIRLYLRVVVNFDVVGSDSIQDRLTK